MAMGLAIAWFMYNGRREVSFIIAIALLDAWIIACGISTSMFYIVFKIGGLI